MNNCPNCDGDGYTEEWNRDQTGVIQQLCERCRGTGKVNDLGLEDPEAEDAPF